MQKTCFKCKKTKDVKNFYKHGQMADGYLGKCKSCTKKDVKDRYNDPEARERIIEYEKKRFQDPKRKERVRIYRLKSRELKPGKYRARNAVTNALRDKRLIKGKCEKCGDERVEAHHNDYRSPLKVQWLCRKHHLEIEGKNSYTT